MAYLLIVDVMIDWWIFFHLKCLRFIWFVLSLEAFYVI